MQGPLAVASFVFEGNVEDYFTRILHALPYPRPPRQMRVAWSAQGRSAERVRFLDLVQSVFGPELTEGSHVLNDTVFLTYAGTPTRALPSTNVSVNAIGALLGPPIIEIAWSSDRKDRDIRCDDVVRDYQGIAARSRCRCSTLGVEQSVLRISGTLVIPASYACAVTCGEDFARASDQAFGPIVERMRRSIGTIVGLPCRVD